MVRTRRTSPIADSNGEDSLNGTQIRTLINNEVSRAVGEAIPEIIAALREEMTILLNERVAAATTPPGNQNRAREFQYRDFSACSPPEFKGDMNPIISMRWISDMECAFLTSGCPDNMKVRFSVNLLRGRAKDWCASALSMAEHTSLSWEDFVVRFRAQFVPPVEMEKMTKEFLELTQTNETVQEINTKFMEMSLFCPQYAATEEMKIFRYKDVLRTEIREFICNAPYTSLNNMMEAARRRELELENQSKKRKAVLTVAPISTVPKKSRFLDSRSGHKSGGFKPREGEEKKCYKCGRSGHLSRDCRSSITVCFNCNQTGHIRTNCPSLTNGSGGGAQRAPVAAPLQITDGRGGSSGSKAAQGRAYQLKVEEARDTPKVVTVSN